MIDSFYTTLIDGYRLQPDGSRFAIYYADGQKIGTREGFKEAAYLLKFCRAAEARAARRLQSEHDKKMREVLNAF